MDTGAAVMWRVLAHNFGWMLGALLLAVLLWVAILGEPVLVTTHGVPILYRNLSPGLLIGRDAPDTVRVELRGPSSKLSAANLSELAVLLDLSGVGGPGERTFSLSDGDLHLPQGVMFLRAVPSQLRLQFAQLETKEVPVQIRITQPPPRGYRVVRQEVVPDHLRIAGPEPRVQQAVSAETDAIDLTAVTQTSEFQVNSFVAYHQGRFESSSIVTVKVIIEKTGNPN
jgi:YbbR domain-containing protein